MFFIVKILKIPFFTKGKTRLVKGRVNSFEKRDYFAFFFAKAFA
jgi:hypothetical protein